MIQVDSSRKYQNRKMYKPPPKDDNTTNFKKLIVVIIISFVFIAGQFIGGYISGSISVISDAFHLVTDLIGFTVAFIFLWFAKKKPNDQMTFGYHRMQLMGALGNLFIIWALAIFLFYQATQRIIEKQFVKQPLAMLIVACVGLPINIVMYFVLHAGGQHSHGLMAQGCGEQYPTDPNQINTNLCSQMICQDIECLITNQYEEHCHKKQGQTQQIHKHQIKVVVQDGQIKRKFSAQLKEKEKHEHDHEHKNCSYSHGEQHKHEHVEHKKKHAHKNGQKHDQNHKHGHEHNHKEGQKCTHNHQSKIKNVMDSQQIINQDHDHDHDHSHHDHSHQSLSMKAAILHALSDVIQSIGLIISSFIIFFAGSQMGKQVQQWNNWHYFDPITTYIFSIIVIVSTIPIAKNCYHIIMQSTPPHLKTKQFQEQFQKVQGVIDVHDLHIWDLRPGKTILIAHVFSRKGQQTAVLKKLTDISRKKRIYHSTFQVEQQQLRHHEEYILCDHDIH